MRGLEVGLGAGTPHWVAMSLNFCNVTIFGFVWGGGSRLEVKNQNEGGDYDGLDGNWEGKGFGSTGSIVLLLSIVKSRLVSSPLSLV